ncbi:MAG: hypothetical protein RIR69_1083 [Actinomycetota bacterium]|jgi:hypothetical protein
MKRRRHVGPIEPVGDGTFVINLSEQDRLTMTGFVEQLEELLESDISDPRLRRLFPVAYHDDPERNAEYQSYMSDELRQSRASSIATVKELLAHSDPISEHQLHGFMIVLNSLRLVLGTLLDVDESIDTDDIDETDPLYGQAQLYGYLGWLLEWTVSALAGE